MKTVTKIMRSIVTSLLFLILTGAIAAHLVFTTIKVTGPTLLNMVDSKELLSIYLEEEIEDLSIEEVAAKYIEDYTNYLFHKRSYPSLQTVNYSQVSEENIVEAKRIITALEDKMDMPYASVTTIREANKILANGAIYLLINVSIFLLYLFITFSTGSFKKSTILISIASIVGSIITLIASFVLIAKLPSIVDEATLLYLKNIISDSFASDLRVATFFYTSIGVAILGSIFTYTKIITPRFSKTK